MKEWQNKPDANTMDMLKSKFKSNFAVCKRWNKFQILLSIEWAPSVKPSSCPTRKFITKTPIFSVFCLKQNDVKQPSRVPQMQSKQWKDNNLYFHFYWPLFQTFHLCHIVYNASLVPQPNSAPIHWRILIWSIT